MTAPWPGLPVPDHGGDDEAAAAVLDRQAVLTKPPGSLGRLEDIVAWLGAVAAAAHAQTRHGQHPRLRRQPRRHSARRIALPPPRSRRRWWRTSQPGGAAINQLARVAGAALSVVPLSLDHPTADIVTAAAMTHAEFDRAWATGQAAVPPGTDLLCLGEMGIGNTTAAAALCTALFGGGDWTGRGTGIDAAGLIRKQATVRAAAARHAGQAPLEGPALSGRARDGGHRAGAITAARARSIPVPAGRLRLHRRRRPARRHDTRRARPLPRRPRLGRSRPPPPARPTRAGPAARPRHATGRGIRCRPRRAAAAGPPSPATPAWQPSRRPPVANRA